MADRVRVAVRVRPQTPSELKSGESCVLDVDTRTVTLYDPVLFASEFNQQRPKSGVGVRNFTFDHAYASSEDKPATQQAIFEELGVLILENTRDGFNSSVFAYGDAPNPIIKLLIVCAGQTGTGKSYTMMGSADPAQQTAMQTQQELDSRGLIPRMCEALLHLGTEIQRHDETAGAATLEISYLEIYNERIRDLFAVSAAPLRLREHPKLGCYVESLTSVAVDSTDTISKLLCIGAKSRTLAATALNDVSSRSHAVMTISYKQRIGSQTRASSIHMVDLAGSERVQMSRASGIRLKEAQAINKSLSALGDVIQALTKQTSRSEFIPYRNSVLTQLLRESLGGNSRTIMIATVSPSAAHYNETMSTLKYVERAKKIVNKAVVNENRNDTLIQSLQSEILGLRKKLAQLQQQRESPPEAVATIEYLTAELLERETVMRQLRKTWEQKLADAQTVVREQTVLLERIGLCTQELNASADGPFFVLLSPQEERSRVTFASLSQCLVVTHVREMNRSQGTVPTSPPQTLFLPGATISPHHCSMFRDQDGCWISNHAAPQFTCLNGRPLLPELKTKLTHGDRLVLGGLHILRFHLSKDEPEDIQHLDWQYAWNEFNSFLRNSSTFLHSASPDSASGRLASRCSQDEPRSSVPKLPSHPDASKLLVRGLKDSLKLSHSKQQSHQHPQGCVEEDRGSFHRSKHAASRPTMSRIKMAVREMAARCTELLCMAEEDKNASIQRWTDHCYDALSAHASTVSCHEDTIAHLKFQLQLKDSEIFELRAQLDDQVHKSQHTQECLKETEAAAVTSHKELEEARQHASSLARVNGQLQSRLDEYTRDLETARLQIQSQANEMNELQARTAQLATSVEQLRMTCDEKQKSLSKALMREVQLIRERNDVAQQHSGVKQQLSSLRAACEQNRMRTEDMLAFYWRSEQNRASQTLDKCESLSVEFWCTHFLDLQPNQEHKVPPDSNNSVPRSPFQTRRLSESISPHESSPRPGNTAPQPLQVQSAHITDSPIPAMGLISLDSSSYGQKCRNGGDIGDHSVITKLQSKIDSLERAQSHTLSQLHSTAERAIHAEATLKIEQQLSRKSIQELEERLARAKAKNEAYKQQIDNITEEIMHAKHELSMLRSQQELHSSFNMEVRQAEVVALETSRRSVLHSISELVRTLDKSRHELRQAQEESASALRALHYSEISALRKGMLIDLETYQNEVERLVSLLRDSPSSRVETSSCEQKAMVSSILGANSVGFNQSLVDACEAFWESSTHTIIESVQSMGKQVHLSFSRMLADTPSASGDDMDYAVQIAEVVSTVLSRCCEILSLSQLQRTRMQLVMSLNHNLRLATAEFAARRSKTQNDHISSINELKQEYETYIKLLTTQFMEQS